MNGDKFRPKQGEGAEMGKMYDEKRWEELTAKETAFYDTYQEGIEMGVPPEELERFAQGVVQEKTEEGDLGFVFRFRKAINLGTPEEINEIGLLAYQQTIKRGDQEAAARLDKEIRGEKEERQVTTPEEAEKMTRQRRKDFGLGEARDLTPEEIKEIEMSIEKLLVDLDGYDFGSCSSERQEEWYWVEQEVNAGIDRELAKANLEGFLKRLQEEAEKSGK